MKKMMMKKLGDDDDVDGDDEDVEEEEERRRRTRRRRTRRRRRRRGGGRTFLGPTYFLAFSLCLKHFVQVRELAPSDVLVATIGNRHYNENSQWRPLWPFLA